MTLRVWHAKINRASLEEYQRFERERCLPMLHKQPGLLGVLFLWQAEDHAASFTIWEDTGAVEALGRRMMARTLFWLASADFLQRIRSKGFLVATLAMVVMATLYVSFYIRERYYGAFSRSLTLPAGILAQTFADQSRAT